MKSVFAVGLAASLVFCACGSSGSGSGGDPTSACMSYCTALRSNGSSCGSDPENCATDCQLWITDSKDAGCPDVLDNLLSCGNNAGGDVCGSLSGACADAYSAWGACNKKCDVPSNVIFSPPCTTSAPCKSGTSVKISSDLPLECSVRIIMQCSGGSATGYIPPGDPTTASGTFTLSCAQASSCIMQVDAANRYLSGATGVSCTP